MAKMQYTEAQEKAILHDGGDLLVAAAAGSGKTRVLVGRLLEEIAKGKNINEFLIITYTRAAAAELKSRILEELGKREAQEPSSHIRRQAALVYQADIGTIHSVFGKFLREYAHKLDLNPDFRQADEQQSKHIKMQVLEDVIEARYATLQSTPGFAELLDHLSHGRQDRLLYETVLNLYEKCNSHPNPRAWADACLLHRNTAGKADMSETPWGKYLLETAQKEVAALYEEMAQTRRGFDETIEQAHGMSWDETLSHLGHFIRATQTGWDATYAACDIPFPRPKNLKAGTYEREKELRKRVKSAMETWGEVFAEPSKEIFADMQKSSPAIAALVDIVFDFEAAYQTEKTRLGILDFSDLEHGAIKLLIDPKTGAPTPEAGEIAMRYHEMMIDEFQDVSALQDTLFRALGEMGARRFMVGDVKQSIYRFRLADPGIFLDYYRKFPEEPAEKTAKKVLLAHNFRSHPGILAAANFIFTRIMSEDFGEMEYGVKESLYPGILPDESSQKEAVVQLDVLDVEELEKDETDKHEMATARHVAEEMLSLEREKGYRFGDFAILLRANSKRRLFEKALEEKGIPVQKAEEEAFFYTEEMATLVSLLQIICNPREDVALIGALGSPLFLFSPDELSEIRLSLREGSFFEALQEHSKTNEKSAAFLERLNHWRSLHPDMSAHAFLRHLLSETHAFSIFTAKTGGRRLSAFVQMAEHFGSSNLFDFCMYLEKCIAENRAPQMGSGAGDAVQIMTIHKSKGLEFPVVFLPNLEKRFNDDGLKKPVLIHPTLGLGMKLQDKKRKIRYDTVARQAIAYKLKQESRAEELRVLYVAMTRAKERLVMITALGKAESALGKLALKAKNPPAAHVLSTCGNMGQWILLCALMRPDAALIRIGEEVPITQTDYPWQIRRIVCKVEEEPLETVTEKETQVPPQIPPDAAFLTAMQFVYPHQQAVDLPSKLTATQMKGRVLDAETLEEAVLTEKTVFAPIFKKPGFVEETLPLTAAQRGTLTHQVMQFLDFSKVSEKEGIQAEITRLVTEEKIPPEAVKAVDVNVIFDFFQSSLGQTLRSVAYVAREFKFSILADARELGLADTDETILLQGVVDAFWEVDGKITVLDFKTDHVPSGKLQEKAALYKGQMETYAYALEKILGKPVSTVLLYFFSAGESVAFTF